MYFLQGVVEEELLGICDMWVFMVKYYVQVVVRREGVLRLLE